MKTKNHGTYKIIRRMDNKKKKKKTPTIKLHIMNCSLVSFIVFLFFFTLHQCLKFKRLLVFVFSSSIHFFIFHKVQKFRLLTLFQRCYFYVLFFFFFFAVPVIFIYLSGACFFFFVFQFISYSILQYSLFNSNINGRILNAPLIFSNEKKQKEKKNQVYIV